MQASNPTSFIRYLYFTFNAQIFIQSETVF